jgi:hypothetical protein
MKMNGTLKRTSRRGKEANLFEERRPQGKILKGLCPGIKKALLRIIEEGL